LRRGDVRARDLCSAGGPMNVQPHLVQHIEELRPLIGEQIALSAWHPVTQAQVDQFAAATDDPDWMHVDIERARQGPVGETIAQGFLTLSLLLKFSHETRYLPPDIAYAFNYGLDRVRWITPVRVGTRIRNRTVLLDLTDRGSGSYLLKTLNTVEIEGVDKPAMIAEWLGLVKTGAAAT
jgi:acyl dehydratase